MRRPKLRGALVGGLVCLLLVLGAVPVLADGPVRAVSSIDRDTITIGDRIELTLIIEVDPGFRVLDPGVSRVIGDVEVIESLPAEQSQLGDGVVRYIYRYEVTAFRTGPQAIAPITVTYQEEGGLQGVAQTAEHPITVASVVQAGEDTSDIKPLKPQLALPVDPVNRLLEAGLLAGGLAVLVGAGVLSARLIAQVIAAARLGQALTPAERAIRELDRIEQLGLADRGDLRQHYELLNACLRRYVIEEYGIDASWRTPRELRTALAGGGVDRYVALMIDEILVESEVVRFGHLAPSAGRAGNAVRVAREVITAAAATEAPAVAEAVR